MSLLVTGSIAIDSVKTPFGQVEEVLGGSAVYFSLAARAFGPVRFVGVVGEDFPQAHVDLLTGRGIDLAGLERRSGSKTFRWRGEYGGNMNEAQTLRTDLNVLGEAGPAIPAAFRDSRYVFLANTHPVRQRELLSQLEGPELVVCDTMNLWIETERAELLQTLAMVNGVVLNDAEARMLTECDNLVVAGRRILEFGPKFVVIKKGEHGVMLVSAEGVFVLPAYPTSEVRDPTGAGDSFAGGMMGYLAAADASDRKTLRGALAHGTITASFVIQDFSINGLLNIDREAVLTRLREFCDMMRFE
jgi:sugar/nucleoside kinase (ribokinase family)